MQLPWKESISLEEGGAYSICGKNEQLQYFKTIFSSHLKTYLPSNSNSIWNSNNTMYEEKHQGS